MSQARQSRTRIFVQDMVWTGFLFVLLVSAILISHQSLSQGTRTSEAEAVAREYMTAFFHGDLQTAASLTHPDTVDLVKSSLLEELRIGKTAAGKPVAPADYGLSLSMHELSELKAEKLYVAVLQADRHRDPAFAEAMRRATVEVSGSREAPDSAVIVTLQVLTPRADGSTFSQETSLLLRQSDSAWKVVGNAP